MKKLIDGLVSFSLRNSLFVIIGSIVLLIGGIIAYMNTPIEAFPDVTSTRSRVIVQWPGRSAEEIEKFITLPISKELNTIPKKSGVRSISLFGLSVITVQFDEDVDDFYAQQYTSARLSDIDLPEGAQVEIEPPSGATGEIFRYYISSERDIKDITALQEWVVERELLSVSGVADVVSFGGEEKIYEIQINPTELYSYGLSPLEVFEAVSNSNINVGGDVITQGDQAFVVRGIGLLDKTEDIGNITIKTIEGTPILVKHVAQVSISGKPRLGQVGFNENDDVVQGIVVMLRGENPSEVIERVKDKIEEINNHQLPGDVEVVPFLDRTNLVNTTVKTVTRNLLEGIILVSIVVFMFLYNWRTTFIVASVIPLSFLFAIICLRIQGLPANLISMGSLDFGLLLEGTLVIVEQVFVSLERLSKKVGMERFNRMSKSGVIRKSISKVSSYIFFAMLILIIALVPIFSFEKVEGKMFSPLAFTLAYALIGSLLLSLTYVPALSKYLLQKNVRERESKISVLFKGWLYKVFSFSFKHRKATLATFIGLVGLCAFKFANHGTEFLPKLNEGAIYVRATLPNSVNLQESVKLTQEIKNNLLEKFPEIDFILTQTGRPNDGTDATGFFNIELHIELTEEKNWGKGIEKEDLVSDIRKELQIYPGLSLGFSQPIQDNVEEYVAGVKSPLVIKVFGHELEQLEDVAKKIENSIQKVPGITDTKVFENLGLPELNIQLHDSKMAQFGIKLSEAQSVVEMTIGGRAATSFYEEERMFDVVLRFEEEYRNSKEKIGEILIPSSTGQLIPLKEIATIEYKTGPAFIYREANSRYIGIGFNIEGRDLGSTIEDAKTAVAQDVSLPKDNRLVWAGEFESKERATKHLMKIVPVSLMLILILLYANFGNLRDTAISSITLAFAFVGGFISLWLTGTIFGISAGIGFIILFGVATIDGIILIGVMKENFAHKKMKLEEAIKSAVDSRIRPVLMIALMGSMGLLPAALSNSMGSEIQKPLAIIIVGGILITMLLSFTVLPCIFYYTYKKQEESK